MSKERLLGYDERLLGYEERKRGTWLPRSTWDQCRERGEGWRNCLRRMMGLGGGQPE